MKQYPPELLVIVEGHFSRPNHNGVFIVHKVKNFSKDERKKGHTGKYEYDRAFVSAALRRTADANDAGQITLITLRTALGDAADGSGKKSQLVNFEWRLDDEELVKQFQQ